MTQLASRGDLVCRELHVVTGAFGYSGRSIAQLLLGAGHRVRTLTNSPLRPHPFGDKIEVRGLDFRDPDRLADSLDGADVLYNTYWVRFNHKDFSFKKAVEDTRILFSAARRAGVKRVVHVSITNASEDSEFEYFRGKAIVERTLRESGLSYAILRPAVFFGGEDILINNIAWVLRHLPVFAVPGDGQYRLQPIYVEDFAALAAANGRKSSNEIVDAVGPETFTYLGLIQTLIHRIGVKRPIISVPPGAAYVAGWALGKLLGDILITRDEIRGLMQNLLVTSSPPTGHTRLTDWASAHRSTLGRRYATEIGRRRNRAVSYDLAR